MFPLYDVIHAEQNKKRQQSRQTLESEQYALEVIWKSLRFADHVTKRNEGSGDENESAYKVKNKLLLI